MQFPAQKIVLIKLLLRLRSQVRIGVRAAGNKTNEQTEEEALQEKPLTSINKPYELTNPPTTLVRHT
jgi:hypothetical protein